MLRRLSKTIFSRTFASCPKQIIRPLNIFIDWFNARSAPNLQIASVILNHVIYSPKMNTNNGCKSTLEKNMFKFAVVTVSIDGLVPVDQLGHWWETMGPVCTGSVCGRMMVSKQGNAFRITLWGESTDVFPSQRASDADHWYFLWY